MIGKRLDPDRPVELATESAIARFDLPHEFPAAALREAQAHGEQVDTREANERVDLRENRQQGEGGDARRIRARYGRLALVPKGPLMTRRFHLGQVSTATAATKNNRLPQKSGRDAQANASPAKYVNHELTSSPTKMAAAQRCATDANW